MLANPDVEITLFEVKYDLRVVLLIMPVSTKRPNTT
jgi:hypothetical protein